MQYTNKEILKDSFNIYDVIIIIYNYNFNLLLIWSIYYMIYKENLIKKVAIGWNQKKKKIFLQFFSIWTCNWKDIFFRFISSIYTLKILSKFYQN